MTTFVTVGPEYNGGMVSVPHHHLFDKLLTDGCTVRLLPSSEFIEHIKPQRVAILEKRFIRRTMCTAHGIHVHFLHTLHITQIRSTVTRPASLRPPSMAVHTFHFHFHAVDIYAVSLTYLDRTKSKTFVGLVLRTVFVQ